MKQHQLDPLHFSLIKSLDDFARKNGKCIRDNATQSELLKSMQLRLQEHLNHKARIHGFHVESMFAFVAATLGQCELISEEDSGTLYSRSGDLIRPDFRIVTQKADQFLLR